MLHRLLSAFALLVTQSVNFAAADVRQNGEIEELIRFVANSDARFVRNGQEYSATEGAEHLRLKLSKAGGRVKTAEDFIEGIATKSSFSGKPYLVKFSDGRTEAAGPWLRTHLAEYRSRNH